MLFLEIEDNQIKEARLTMWQPIETAPKAEVILVYSICDGVETAYYGNESKRWLGTGTGDDLLDQPTHWMPLPRGPSKSK